MNNNQRQLIFIAKAYPDLYRILMEINPFAFDNTPSMDAEDAATCNRLIDDYCKTHNIDYETCNYLLKFVN